MQLECGGLMADFQGKSREHLSSPPAWLSASPARALHPTVGKGGREHGADSPSPACVLGPAGMRTR